MVEGFRSLAVLAQRSDSWSPPKIPSATKNPFTNAYTALTYAEKMNEECVASTAIVFERTMFSYRLGRKSLEEAKAVVPRRLSWLLQDSATSICMRSREREDNRP